MHTRFKEDEPSVNWITSNEALAQAVTTWSNCLTIDTEFVRTNTYYPMPGLYQVGTEHSVYLLDPLSISDWQPFTEVLSDVNVVKVMHACQEDSELLYHHLGVKTAGVFDTQFAHAFVSDQFSLSYANLVEKRLNVTLGKHETRSDWLARPLSAKQIAYAVEDVTFLEPLYHALLAELESQGKVDWFRSDMVERALYEPGEPLEYYKNVKKAWHLAPVELGRLQQLCAWREETARQENVPRNRVVWDEHLYAFASTETLTRELVRTTLPRGVASRYEDQLLELLQNMVSLAPPALPKPLTTQQGVLVKRLRACGLAAAEKHGLAPELICRKKDLEGCVRQFVTNGELSSQFSDWRQDLIGQEYLRVLQETN